MSSPPCPAAGQESFPPLLSTEVEEEAGLLAPPNNLQHKTPLQSYSGHRVPIFLRIFGCREDLSRQGPRYIQILSGQIISFLIVIIIYGSFPKLGVHFGGSYNQDYHISESILGCPILGNDPITQLCWDVPGTQFLPVFGAMQCEKVGTTKR